MQIVTLLSVAQPAIDLIKSHDQDRITDIKSYASRSPGRGDCDAREAYQFPPHYRPLQETIHPQEQAQESLA